MQKRSRGVWIGLSVLGLAVAGIFLISSAVNSQPPEVPGTVAKPAPPTGQSYTGVKRCSSCHFKQYMTWKKTKHAKEAWESVTAKYRTAAECLPCHTTGYGQADGFQGRGFVAESDRHHLRGLPRPGQQARGGVPAVRQQEAHPRRREDRPGFDLQGATPATSASPATWSRGTRNTRSTTKSAASRKWDTRRTASSRPIRWTDWKSVLQCAETMRTVVPILVLLAVPAIVVGAESLRSPRRARRPRFRPPRPLSRRLPPRDRLAHPARRQLLRAVSSGAGPEGSRHPAAVRRPQGAGRRRSLEEGRQLQRLPRRQLQEFGRPRGPRQGERLSRGGRGGAKMCAVCHENQALDLVKSVHAKAGEKDERGRGTPLWCRECHGPNQHQILPVADSRSPVFVDHQVQTCGRCHEKEQDSFGKTSHGHGLYQSGLLVRPPAPIATAPTASIGRPTTDRHSKYGQRGRDVRQVPPLHRRTAEGKRPRPGRGARRTGQSTGPRRNIAAASELHLLPPGARDRPGPVGAASASICRTFAAIATPDCPAAMP